MIVGDLAGVVGLDEQDAGWRALAVPGEPTGGVGVAGATEGADGCTPGRPRHHQEVRVVEAAFRCGLDQCLGGLDFQRPGRLRWLDPLGERAGGEQQEWPEAEWAKNRTSHGQSSSLRATRFVPGRLGVVR